MVMAQTWEQDDVEVGRSFRLPLCQRCSPFPPVVLVGAHLSLEIPSVHSLPSAACQDYPNCYGTTAAARGHQGLVTSLPGTCIPQRSVDIRKVHVGPGRCATILHHSCLRRTSISCNGTALSSPQQLGTNNQ